MLPFQATVEDQEVELVAESEGAVEAEITTDSLQLFLNTVGKVPLLSI